MSTSVTETAEYSNASLPSRGQDGDTIYMDGGGAPLWTVIQRLYNRTAHHEALLLGQLVWSGDFAVSGTAPNNFTVTIGAIDSINLYNATASKCLTYAGGTITQTKVEGGGGTLTAAAQWWYVYAFLSGGAIDFEISTTAPDATRQIKSGSGTRRYLGCFRTLATGVPIPVRACRGRYVYDLGASALADLNVVTGGASAVYASVPCSTLVPPHGRIATLDVRGVLPGGGGVVASAVEVQSYGSAGALSHVLYVGPGAALETRGAVFDVMLDSSQRAQYKVNGGANAPTTEIYVAGFYE